MDIKTSSRVGKPLSAPSQERPTEATRPPHERWYVGSDVFSSTSEMLASGEDLDGKNAVYDYAFFTRDEELSEAEKKRSGRRFALVAGGIGAGLTTLIGGATVLNYMDGYGTLLQPIKVIGGMLAATALIAGGAYKIGYHEPPDTSIYSQKGVIRQHQHSTNLYLRGDINREVDLRVHAEARVPEVKPNGLRDYGQQWWNHP